MRRIIEQGSSGAVAVDAPSPANNDLRCGLRIVDRSGSGCQRPLTATLLGAIA